MLLLWILTLYRILKYRNSSRILDEIDTQKRKNKRPLHVLLSQVVGIFLVNDAEGALYLFLAVDYFYYFIFIIFIFISLF